MKKLVIKKVKFDSAYRLLFLLVIGIFLCFGGCARRAKIAKVEPVPEPPKPSQPLPEEKPSVQIPSKPEEKEALEIITKRPVEEELLPEEERLLRQLDQLPKLYPVYFAFDKYDLTHEAIQTLKINAVWLKRNPHVKVIIEGHCDERGSVEYNLALGEKRAKTVEEFYITLGVDPNQLRIISYGEERPVDPGKTEEAYAKNRRAETVKLTP